MQETNGSIYLANKPAFGFLVLRLCFCFFQTWSSDFKIFVLFALLQIMDRNDMRKSHLDPQMVKGGFKKAKGWAFNG